MVTAVSFVNEGQQVVAGTMRGKCRFYKCTGAKLEYIAQVGIMYCLSFVLWMPCTACHLLIVGFMYSVLPSVFSTGIQNIAMWR